MAIQPECAPQDHGSHANAQIQLQPGLRTQSYDEGLLPGQTVIIPVAEVIHDQQRINHQPAGYRRQEHLPRHIVYLHVVGAAHRYEPEEHEHQHVAQSLIREERRIEEGEHHAEGPDQDHLQSAIPR